MSWLQPLPDGCLAFEFSRGVDQSPTEACDDGGYSGMPHMSLAYKIMRASSQHTLTSRSRVVIYTSVSVVAVARHSLVQEYLKQYLAMYRSHQFQSSSDQGFKNP